MLDCSRDGDVFVLRLDAGENRFTPALMDALDTALDTVEQASAPAALVTIGTGKFYSNGLDLEEMMRGGAGSAGTYLGRVLGILGRILTFPAPTVAAMNGHAFGAGALLGLVHDVRLMRSDRGFFCMPEVDMKIPLHPGMVAILKSRLPAQTAHEVVTTGRRFGGEEARALGIVEEAMTEDALLARATTIAGERASKANAILRTLKTGFYGQVLDALAKPLSM
ncbi:MAG TPA: enoyl-CoA hydratase/isomerase family protein [Candidatus Binatia bacterium]|jgi:enoyl-CoA hydratase/carnithine racemase|nr:enoyl-CoA hydratase/isomerase family protein [Candidatus Binatia bacterium]